MNESRLMIVMDDTSWTLAALHLACAISRRGETEVLLLKMLPVRHPSLLGTEAGFLDFAAEDAQVLAEMVATTEDYGVSLDVQLFFPLDDLKPSLVWTPSITLQNDMARLLEQRQS